jgi:uncharacterized protein
VRAWKIVAAVFLALGLAALLNAQGLRKTAVIQPPGLGRDVAMAVTAPLVRVSHFLYLDRPRQELKEALGRSGDDRIDTRIVLPALPAQPAPRLASVVRVRTTAKPKAKPKPLAPPKPKVDPRPKAQPKPQPKPRPKPQPPRPAFSPSHPLRVWVAGDSLASVPGQSLERATGSSGAVDVVSVESRLATGLGRPEIFNWFERIGGAVAELRPNVAVLSFGADDDHDFMSGVPAGKTLGPLGSPSWIAEYRRRAAGVQEELTRAGVYVVWLGLPITRGEGWNRPFRTINKILKGVAAASPDHAYFLGTYTLFQDSHGHYAEYLPNAQGQLVKMRSGDGVHYEAPAGDLIARLVLHRLNQKFDLTSWKRK